MDNAVIGNAVIIYRPSSKCLTLARRILDSLRNKGVRAKSYWVDDVIKRAIGYTDLVVAVGGDGTLLKISRVFQEYSPLVFPVPCGRRTVYYEELGGDIEEYIDRIMKGEFYIEVLDRVNVFYNGKKFKVLNEAAFISRDRGRVLRFEVVVKTPTTRSRIAVEADGVLIGPSSGSSAYNLSVGGSLVIPDLHTIFLTFLNPMELNIKPLILPQLSSILLKTHGFVDVYIDGELLDLLGPGIEVKAELDHIGFRIIRFGGKRNYVKEVFDKRKVIFEE